MIFKKRPKNKTFLGEMNDITSESMTPRHKRGRDETTRDIGCERDKICRVCRGDGPFYESSRANLCKDCSRRAAKARRLQSPESLLAYRWYNSQRRRLGKAQKWIKEDKHAVRRVLERCNYRSVISGADDVELLCIVPYFRKSAEMTTADDQHASLEDMSTDIDMHIQKQEWNYVLVTQGEARKLTHLRSEKAAQACFPLAIQIQMDMHRQGCLEEYFANS